MSIRAHRDAVMADLRERLPSAVFRSYEDRDENGNLVVYPKKYAVVFIALSSSPRTRYTGGQTREVFTVTVHSVGVGEDESFWVAERVNKLKGRVLHVPGRSLWPVEYVTGQPPNLDDDSTSPLVFTVSQFDIISDPV